MGIMFSFLIALSPEGILKSVCFKKALAAVLKWGLN